PRPPVKASYRPKLGVWKHRPMSAMGQKRTCAAQTGMSALAPIATAKADIGKPSGLLYPESGHMQCTSACPPWAKSGHYHLFVPPALFLAATTKLFDERP